MVTKLIYWGLEFIKLETGKLKKEEIIEILRKQSRFQLLRHQFLKP